MQEKTCPSCGETKAVSEFCKNKRRKDGLQVWCKTCERAYRLNYQQTEKGKESMRRKQKKYRQTEKGKETKRRFYHTRRSRKAGAAGFHDFAVSLEIYGHRCALCGDAESKLTVGHIIPLSRGGSNWQFNIRPECKPCNSSKKDRLDQST